MKNVLILDFYNTVVTPVNQEDGKSYWNLQPNLPMWKAIKMMSPDFVFIFENENFADKAEMRDHQFLYEYFRRSLGHFLSDIGTFVEFDFCPYSDSDVEYRKPNLGMYRTLFVRHLKAKYTHPFSDPDTRIVCIGHELEQQVAEKMSVKFVATEDIVLHI